jgi:hypothetical protein
VEHLARDPRAVDHIASTLGRSMFPARRDSQTFAGKPVPLPNDALQPAGSAADIRGSVFTRTREFPMDGVTSSAVSGASSSTPGSVQGVASVLVLKKALDMQAASATRLIESLPQPALASSGTLGTKLNTYA